MFRKVLVGVGSLAILLAAGAGSPPGAPAKQSFVSKAKSVALDYWHARKPDADCDDRPVDVVVRPSRFMGGQKMEAGPIGECGRPYYPEGSSPPYILVAKEVRRRSWPVFCTTVIQGWGLLTGELFDKKHPGDIMYPEVTKKNVERKACGHRP